MGRSSLKNIRRDYKHSELSKTSVNKDPFVQFNNWFNEIVNAKIIDPSAMVLATVAEANMPSARIVLLKEVDVKGFVFFTNYLSRKAKDLETNPNASLLFYWKEMDRQLRIEGIIEKVKTKISEDYFHTRPRESQISAWVSKQSSIVPDRNFLDKKYDELDEEFGNDEIPLPDFWGGYRLIPEYFEFWQGRESRLHDRICYRKEKGNWKIFRLAP
ncbi:MAG: pyridoxamine 5'-phosphate oxidase [Bacteroidetes bacterium]|nr:pyridoxamine 5'-phosphate oxidase [Bacteroidota bacterium]MCH7771715.1 pyridoxamine 5'-phosphate oxidase [Bacteroidota bacterium]